MKRILLLIALFAATVGALSAQSVALKTNLLYGGLTLTPNLGLEVGLGRRTTLDLSAGYNPWHVHTPEPKLAHWLGQVEFRYWFCERFNGLFLGAHALGTQFNIAGHKLPMLFGADSKDFQYQGYAYGAGVSVGYQFILARRWNLELNLGVGYARLQYDKYDCKNCGSKVETTHRDYFGPTRAGVSLIFLIGRH